MAVIKSFIIFLSVLLVVCLQNSEAQYEFFKLVQQWPISTCNVQTPSPCQFPPKLPLSNINFTLHGLWGTNKTRPYPTYCSRTPFNVNSIQTLMPRMDISWPSYTNLKLDFWKHEWTAHGTCSENNFNQADYFKLALDSKDRVDVLKVLANSGIHPGGQQLGAAGFKSALKNFILAEVEVRCNKDNSGVIQLHEVVLCMDDHGNNFIDCPPSTDGPVRLCNRPTVISFPV